MGLPWWLLTGCAALVGLAVGYWLADADREKLRKAAAAKAKAAEGLERALEEKERALSQKMQEVAENEQAMTIALRDTEQRQKAGPKRQARRQTKAKAKPASGKKVEAEGAPSESM